MTDTVEKPQEIKSINPLNHTKVNNLWILAMQEQLGEDYLKNNVNSTVLSSLSDKDKKSLCQEVGISWSNNLLDNVRVEGLLEEYNSLHINFTTLKLQYNSATSRTKDSEDAAEDLRREVSELKAKLSKREGKVLKERTPIVKHSEKAEGIFTPADVKIKTKLNKVKTK
jgi:predicted Zn-dependent peptidase